MARFSPKREASDCKKTNDRMPYGVRFMLPRIPSPHARRACMPCILKARQAEGSSKCHSPDARESRIYARPRLLPQMTHSCKTGIDNLTICTLRIRK